LWRYSKRKTSRQIPERIGKDVGLAGRRKVITSVLKIKEKGVPLISIGM
jgi:hypothetical protein